MSFGETGKLEGIERAVLRSRAWRVTRTVLPFVFALDELPSRAEVLELGTGGGFNAELLLDRFPEWRLLVTDVDPEMLELAGRRLAKWSERMRAEHADATELPYAHETFDVVISILVWHHVGDWRKATSEAARVLRPGGHLLFADIFKNRVNRGAASIDRSTRYTKRALLEAAGLCGLRVRHLRSLGGFACAFQAEKEE